MIPLKFLVKDSFSRPALVVIFSSLVSPDLVAKNVKNDESSAKILGESLNFPILCALRQGYVEGLSYGVWEYCAPLSENFIVSKIQKIMLSSSVFHWLRKVTNAAPPQNLWVSE